MQVTKFASKFRAGAAGTLSVAAGGIGSDLLMRTLDNIVGSPVQRIFSFNLPLLGTIGPIDVLNYAIYAGGFKLKKSGFIAVLAAKIAGGVLPSIGPIRLPTTGANPTGQSASAGAAGGASF